MKQVIIVLMAALLSGSAIANECMQGNLDSAEPTVIAEVAASLGARSPAGITICRVGDFAVTWNNDTKDNSVLLLLHDQPLFSATATEDPRTHQKSMIAMVLEAGRPKVHLTDANGDGEFDEIGYDVYDLDNRSITTIVDDDADGHPDYELVGTGQGRPALRVKIDEKWFDLTWRDGRLGAIAENDFRPVTNTPTGWRFEEK